MLRMSMKDACGHPWCQEYHHHYRPISSKLESQSSLKCSMTHALDNDQLSLNSTENNIQVINNIV